ncbi:MAG TPA: 2OG-Fe(II) oxygenase family protein, partial [Candidatus Nanoarchaeia archaeon]|nr:2OG-Fe(II) oxygenase family protein [Candidatus Nanoarchaeia archaeon]
LKREFSSNQPFPQLVLGKFFTKKINKVAAALLKEKFYEHNSDLYQFQQTDDCRNAKQPAIKQFHKFFSSKEFIQFISKITDTQLKFIDMSGFIYDDTDYLLPHDDRLSGRKIAYIVNLTKNFTKEDGGALQFFKDNKIVKSIPPTFNTFTIFKVSPKSLHQVQEIVTNKKRLSFAGWFHA